jgi:hypothetical protein
MTTEPLWKRFAAMTDEEVEAMRAAHLARLEKGERAMILGCALRLAQATGCPEGEPVFPWLVKCGLAVEHDDGSYEITEKGTIFSKGAVRSS